MKIKPKVSIVIPYHKKKNFFTETINSILFQSYKNFEIIIIYDDTNKDELNYLKKITQKNKKIKLIVNNKIMGPGISRNKGILKTNGTYLAFCDADDLWKRNKLEVQLNFMLKNKINFSHTSYNIINDKSKKIGKFKIREIIEFNDLMKSCDIGLSTVIIKRNLFKGNIKFCDLRTKEDYYLWLKVVKKIKILYGLNNYLSSWRLSKDSISRSLNQKISDAFKLYYYYEKYNIFISIFFVIRLSFYAFIKKIKIYN